MKKTSIIIVIVFLVVLFAVPPAPAAGQKTATMKTKSGATYHLVVPPGAGPKKPCPLLVAIHGDGYSAKVFQGDWMSYAASIGCILALPEKANPSSAGWSRKDVDNIKEVIDEVRAAYGVQARLTAVAGHSSGGSVAYNIALAKPDAVSAIISIAGNMVPNAKKLKDAKKFGVFIMHGTADTIIPIARARTAADTFKKAGYEVTLKEVAGHQHATPFPSAPMTEAVKFLAVWFKKKARVVEKPGAEGLLEWAETDAALEELKTDEKPGLIYFYSKKDTTNALSAFLEWDLFPSSGFKEKAEEFILIRVDRDENKELAKKLKVKKCTLMFVDKNMKKLKSYVKPPTMKKLLKYVEKILKKYEKKREKKEKK
jgi:pimeloyl-ACP methyl ester carboxylesterase